MAEMLIEIASWVLLCAGGFFLVVGGIGLNRMPDLYTRLHATSVSDSAGAGLLLIGLMLQAGLTLVTVKLVFLLVIFFFTTPVATHAVTRAALAFGVEPLQARPDGTLWKGRTGDQVARSERRPVPDPESAPARRTAPRKRGRARPSKR